MLAVSTVDNGIKILANSDGIRLLRTLESRSFDASRSVSENLAKVWNSCDLLIFDNTKPLDSIVNNNSCLMQPVISPLSTVAVATSSGILDRVVPPVVVTGMVCQITQVFLLFG